MPRTRVRSQKRKSLVQEKDQGGNHCLARRIMQARKRGVRSKLGIVREFSTQITACGACTWHCLGGLCTEGCSCRLRRFVHGDAPPGNQDDDTSVHQSMKRLSLYQTPTTANAPFRRSNNLRGSYWVLQKRFFEIPLGTSKKGFLTLGVGNISAIASEATAKMQDLPQVNLA